MLSLFFGCPCSSSSSSSSSRLPCTQTCTVPQSEQSFYTTRLGLILQKLVKWVKPKPVYEPALPVFVESRSLCSGGRPCTQTCTVPQSVQTLYTTRLSLILQKLVKWVKPKPVYEPAQPVFVESRSLCSGGRPCTQTCTVPQSEQSFNTTEACQMGETETGLRTCSACLRRVSVSM